MYKRTHQGCGRQHPDESMIQLGRQTVDRLFDIVKIKYHDDVLCNANVDLMCVLRLLEEINQDYRRVPLSSFYQQPIFLYQSVYRNLTTILGSLLNPILVAGFCLLVVPLFYVVCDSNVALEIDERRFSSFLNN